jgi:hypothetical protein
VRFLFLDGSPWGSRREELSCRKRRFPGRSHYTLGQDGWEEVAHYALTCAAEHATAKERVAFALTVLSSRQGIVVAGA